MAGATSFEIQLGHFESTLQFPGAHLDRHELTQLFDYLLFTPATRNEWALHELAIGLKASTNAGVELARIEQNQQTILVKSDRCELEDRPSNLEPETLCLRLLHNRPWVDGIWRWLFRGTLPESRELLQSLSFSPIPGELTQGRLLLQVQANELEKIPVPAPLISGQLEHGWIAVGANGELGKRQPSNLTMVIRGRPFSQNLRLGRGNIQAVIRADDLRLDLSQSGPVQDSRYLAVVRPLTQEIEELRYRWLRDHPSPGPKDKTYRAIARQVVRSLRTKGRLTEALEVCQKAETSPSQLWNLHFVMGRPDEAVAVLQDELKQELSPHSLDRRYLELATIEGGRGNPVALEYWERAYQSVKQRNQERRPHVVAECEESRLAWLPQFETNGKKLRELWERVLEGKRHLGEQHPRLAPTLELGAWLALQHPLLKAGKFADELLLQIRQGALPPSQSGPWNYEEALKLAQRAYQIRREHRGEGDPASGRALSLMALSSHLLGSAEPNYALQRLSLMSTVYGPKHPDVAASHHLLAAVGQDPAENLKEGARILAELELPQPEAPNRVVCYRGWFHSRSAWICTLPLTWPIEKA